ncbi:phospholipase D-like domain-containing protein [Duganella sp.]|uniref:phospholipase D-like domain-containing protein n=1 Tax=Duganella sp. TaxID=1904440 RepID=UPI0031DFBD70
MSASHDSTVTGSIYQIVDKQGKPAVAAHAIPLWVDRTSSDVFSMPTQGNKIESYCSGKDYFSDLINECDRATNEIYIAGWQVNWDALLVPGVRLYDLLLRCAKRGVHIYVMPWNDSEPIQTYDDQTKIVLESINDILEDGPSKGSVTVTLCSSFASVNNAYYSHHQKQVVIDRKIAYVGGMDLCYGRMDDARFDLRPDLDGRRMLNRYNPSIPPLHKVDPESASLVDPDLMSGAADTFGVRVFGHTVVKSTAQAELKKIAGGGWQVPYDKPGSIDIVANKGSFSSNKALPVELDATRQPRMPWQDVHCKIQGPAVSALLKNFILRWNVATKAKTKKLPRELPAKLFPMEGKAQIQVLRSAPAHHCAEEHAANPGSKLQKGQHDIHIAMKHLIAKATRFIYIENQFFVSDFGSLGHADLANLSPVGAFIKNGANGISDTTLKLVRKMSDGPPDEAILDKLPSNGVLKALLDRLKKCILDDVSKPKFHVYITLPVHPEGALIDASIAVQVYYTMQTLVYGSHSLINGIRRLIKARELKDAKVADYLAVLNDEANTQYESVPVAACYEYVTLLNLRNWHEFTGNFVTEQIYVHSKVMIVDDRFALLGSANINDRSLLGERDSELAVLVMDDDTKRADINGKGSNQPVRVFAHELRIKIWNKIFGITCGVRAADELKTAIESPGQADSWKLIQRRAQRNTDIYDSAFAYIPRNTDPSPERLGQPAKILPTWDDKLKLGNGKVGGLAQPMPFQTEFWDKPQAAAGAAALKNIRGFITLIPLDWTANENIRIKYPTGIIVHNEHKVPLEDEENARSALVAASNGSNYEQNQPYG